MHDDDTLIDLPRRVKNFFAGGQYYQKYGIPSYSQVVGEDPLPIPADFQDERGFRYSKFRVRNATQQAITNAEDEVRKIFAAVFMQSPDNINMINRHYMLLGGTMPIRLEARVGRHETHTLYVKRPDPARIFGKILYNLLSGLEEQDFLFGDAIYVERKIEGYHPNVDNRAHLQTHGVFVRNLVRLAALDELLSINDLTEVRGRKEEYVNIIVTASNKAVAFDFDLLFSPDSDEPKLVDFMRSKGWKISPSLESEIMASERAELTARVSRNEKEFYRVVELMDDVPELKARVIKFGNVSFSDYFLNQLNRMASTIPRNGASINIPSN